MRAPACTDAGPCSVPHPAGSPPSPGATRGGGPRHPLPGSTVCCIHRTPRFLSRGRITTSTHPNVFVALWSPTLRGLSRSIPVRGYSDMGPGCLFSETASRRTIEAVIHRVNLESLDRLMDDRGHPKSCECECMKSKSGNSVVMPCCERGLCMRGCQEREFQGRLVECCCVIGQVPPEDLVAVLNALEPLTK